MITGGAEPPHIFDWGAEPPAPPVPTPMLRDTVQTTLN